MLLIDEQLQSTWRSIFQLLFFFCFHAFTCSTLRNCRILPSEMYSPAKFSRSKLSQHTYIFPEYKSRTSQRVARAKNHPNVKLYHFENRLGARLTHSLLATSSFARSRGRRFCRGTSKTTPSRNTAEPLKIQIQLN